MRITVYDPALEPIKVIPWDPQTHSGPEAPSHAQLPAPAWIRLAAAEGISPGTCLIIADHRLACMIFPEREAGSGGRHEG